MLLNFITYLFYGLAFFTLGLVILSKDKSGSKIPFSKSIWLFALFGITHGVHEWLELYIILEISDLPVDTLYRLIMVKYNLLALSYLFLVFFSMRTFEELLPSKLSVAYKTSISMLIVIIYLVVLNYSLSTLQDYLIRYLFGFSGAVMSAVSFVLVGKSVRNISEKATKNLYLTGVFTFLYGIASGIIPSVVIYGNLHVGTIRGGLAIIILIFIMKSIKVFDLEYILALEDKVNRLALNEKLSSLGKMAAEIAHEINNPLANASLGIDLLKGKISAEDETVRKKIESIETNVDKASNIVRELLLYARTNQDVSFVSIKVEELVKSISVLLKNSKKYDKIVLNFEKDAEFYGSFYKMEELLINLIFNALESSNSDDLKVEVKIFSKDDFMIFEVSDNGAGMTSVEIKNAFEPFYTTKPHGKGTGLGLYISYNIVKLHKGDINIESEPGRGTKITVKIQKGER